MSLEKYVYSAKVLSNHDGDTVTLLVDCGFRLSFEMVVRLSRIDTPELRAPTMVEGAASRDFVRQKVVGKAVTIKTEKDKTEKYGRYLADIYYTDDLGKETCLNDQLVLNGFAVYRTY